MALNLRLAPLNKAWYHLSVSQLRSSHFLLFPFSTAPALASASASASSNSKDDKNPVNATKNLDEHRVLDQLSSLLPISRTHPIPLPQPTSKQSDLNTQVEVEEVGAVAAAADGFLSPEEKLRGVFLQKLKGKPAIELALTNAGVDLSLDVVSGVLNRGNLGAESMIVFFNWAIKQRQPVVIPKDIRSCNVLLRALGRRKFIDFMVKVLLEMRTEGVIVNLDTLSIVFDSLARARRVHKAIQMFRNSEEFGFERDTESLNVLLQCLCKRSHVGAACSYFNSVKETIPFDIVTYNSIIGGWAKFGRVDEIERVMKAMFEDSFSPDCLTFSYLIEGLGRARRIQEAVEVFENMEERGCVPDTRVYNAMICNFISVGDLNGCMKYYKRMLDNNCPPDDDTYTNLISASIKARKVADALELFDEMLGQGIVPSTGMITSFIEPLCSFGPPYAAMFIYKKARKVGCKVSMSAYKLLLMRLSVFGKCGMLLDIWDEMLRSGYSCDMESYEHVINGLCNIGQLENAVLVLEESLQKGFCPSRLTYSKLSNKLIAANKVERAYKLFLKVKDARQNQNARRFWRANGWHF